MRIVARDVSWAISEPSVPPRDLCGVVLMKVKALEGDTVDSLSVSGYYGTTQGVTEKVLDANPRTLSAGNFWTPGQEVEMPEAGEEETRE